MKLDRILAIADRDDPRQLAVRAALELLPAAGHVRVAGFVHEPAADEPGVLSATAAAALQRALRADKRRWLKRNTAGLLPRHNLPPAAVLPEKLVHVTGRTIPGQFAGQMGWKFDPWFIEASQFKDTKYVHGAFPQYGFQRWEGATVPADYVFEAPRLELPQGVLQSRFDSRMDLLKTLDHQRRQLDQAAQVGEFDRHRQSAVSLLSSGGVHKALDVHGAPSSASRCSLRPTTPIDQH